MTPAEARAKALGAKTKGVDGTKIAPMTCEREEASDAVLARADWIYELKIDGVRIVADKKGEGVSLWYRKHRQATASYPEIAEAVATLEDERLVLDGEIVAFDEHGKPDFQRLATRIQGAHVRGRAKVAVVYVVFDVLAVGHYDVRGLPLEARSELLSRILPDDRAAGGLLRRNPSFDRGTELFRLCREQHLEGVVAKRRGSVYRAGERSADWLKIKSERDAEFVVIGWTEGEKSRAPLGAIEVGSYEGDRLVYRGRAGSGLALATLDLLLEHLRRIEVDKPVAEGEYSSAKTRRHHCAPELVVSVRYGGWSRDASGSARFLRFPVFRGLRPDVDPKDCTARPEDR